MGSSCPFFYELKYNNMESNFEIPDGFTKRIIDIDGAIIYNGYSKIGTDESDKNWIIVKIDTTGTSVKYSFSSGVSFDDRKTVAYR